MCVGVKLCKNLMNVLTAETDTELLVYTMTLINKVLSTVSHSHLTLHFVLLLSFFFLLCFHS